MEEPDPLQLKTENALKPKQNGQNLLSMIR